MLKMIKKALKWYISQYKEVSKMTGTYYHPCGN